ncbi:MAG: Cache sensor protein [Cecembia sp.]
MMKIRGLVFFFILVMLVQCGPSKKNQFDKTAIQMNAFITLLEYDLQVLEGEIEFLGDKIQELFIELGSITDQGYQRRVPAKRGIHNNAGIDDPDACTTYISEIAEEGVELEKLLRVTESVDDLFKDIVRRHEMVTQVYFNSKQQVNKLYPPYDALAMLVTDLDLTSFNFYYLADEENNPGRSTLWVDELYIDPVGKGWMISLLHPIYVDDELMMVLAFDVTLNTIIDNYLNNFDNNFIIVDATGTLVAGKTKAIESMSLPPLKNHTYTQTITSDTFRKEEYNLFRSKSSEVRKMASKLILANEDEYLLTDYGFQAQVTTSRMNVLDWVLFDLSF